MRILINTANLSSGGGLQVAISLLFSFDKIKEHQVQVLASPQIMVMCDQGNSFPNLHFHSVNENPSASFGALVKHRKMANGLVDGEKIEKVLTIFGPSLWRPKVPHLVGFAQGYYLYPDSFFVKHIYAKSIKQKLQYFFKRKAVLNSFRKDSSAIWIETEVAKNELSTTDGFTNKEIHVIPNTYGAFFKPYLNRNNQPPSANANDGKLFRFLIPSAPHPNKNLTFLNTLFPFFQNEKLSFSVTLSPEDFTTLFGQLPNNQKTIVNIGVIKPQDLPNVYQQHDAVFLPSLLEIFSASWPEAMAMGMPIMAVDMDSAKAICGAAALYFDPTNMLETVEKVIVFVANQNLRNSLVEEGDKLVKNFIRPEERAIRLLEILEQL